MTEAEAAIQGAEAAQGAEQAWQAVRADESIQYAPVTFPPPEPPPEWLMALGRTLGQFFLTIWPVFKWMLLAGLVLLVLFALWRLIDPMAFRRRPVPTSVTLVWQPDRSEAEALLSDADALAQAGRYDEAAHLLLRRSVSHIAAARAEWVRPASTARELSCLAALPEAARQAFGEIARSVERSRYAMRPLSQDDWQAARSAYANFALQRLPATTG